MYGIPSHHQPLSCVFHTRVIVHYPKWCIQNISVIFIDMVECNIVYLQSTEEMGISLDFWLYSKYFMALRVIWQYMDRSVTNKILYGPKLLRSIYYLFGDGPVHILPYDPKWHELFVLLYFLSKIIMQGPFRNRIENEAVHSRSI